MPSYEFSRILQFCGGSQSFYAASVLVFLAVALLVRKAIQSDFSHIPLAHSMLPGISMLRCIMRTQDYLHDGYVKTKKNVGLFKFPSPNCWIIVATSPETIRDLYRASDQELSSYAAIEEILQFTHTLGPEILGNPYHMPLLSSLLAKRLDELCPAIFEEIEHVFSILLPGHKQELSTSTMNGSKFIETLVSRVSNRVFVGKPLCRDQRFLDLVSNFVFKMTITGFVLSGTPVWLRSFVAFFISPNWSQRKVSRLMEPIVKQRQAMLEENKSGTEPTDFLWSMMQIAEGEETSCMALTLRILHVNFAAVSSTSTVACLVLNHIAYRPDWQEQLHDEVQAIIDQEGWTLAALSRMERLDSIVKEVMRFHHFSATTIGRIVKDAPFVFSNGISVPPGSLLCAASREVGLEHFGSMFDPFRFSSATEDIDFKPNPTHGCTTTSPEFMAWGHGRHACPGRYFAVCQIKAIAAYALFHYKVTIGDMRAPANKWQFVMAVPDKSLDFQFEPRNK